jgi:hypothetical protein
VEKRWMSTEEAGGSRTPMHHGPRLDEPRPRVVRRTPVVVGLEFLVEPTIGIWELPELTPVCLHHLRLLALGGVEDDDGAGVGVGVPDCLEPPVPVEAVAMKVDAASILAV